MISVIMSTYREKVGYVIQSIASIRNQTYTDLEIIIVLDDPNNQEISSAVEQLATEDSRIVVIQNPHNLGLPMALNEGLAIAKGDFIARMDADDISHPQRFEHQLSFMRKHHLDLVGTCKRCIDEDGALIPGSNSKFYSPEEVMRRLRVDDCIPHATWLAKKSVYDTVGGYRSMPRCEDYDFLLRAHKLAIPMGLCDEILFDHRINDSGISRSGALEQVLASWYLTGNYERIEQVTPEEVTKNVCSQLTESKIRHYKEAADLFECAAKMYREKKMIKCGMYLVRCACTSRYCAYKIFNSVKFRWTERFIK